MKFIPIRSENFSSYRKEKTEKLKPDRYKSISLWKSFLVKKISLVFVLLCLTLVAFADRYSHLELFAQTLNLIKTNYFKPVKMETLIYGAIKGLLKEIDPHSHFLLPEDLKKLKEEAQGQFYGLGIEAEKKGDFLVILSLVPNSPAHKAGLQPGDKILKINGKIIKNFNRSEFRSFIKKNQADRYKLTILRVGHDQPLVFPVWPIHLKIQSVSFKQMQKGLFYIRIYYFSEKTLFEINKFLRNKKIKALLLDLRGNPGGILKQSVKTADLFLSEGLIVRYKIKTEKKVKSFSAHYSNTLPDFPLVVLIDEYSASASEIVAGALKDHKRAVLVGRKTFGKGSIQNIFHLNRNHALKLTVGEYQTPSGEFIHEKGIKPHIQIAKKNTKQSSKTTSKKGILKDPEVYQAFQVLKKQVKNKLL